MNNDTLYRIVKTDGDAVTLLAKTTLNWDDLNAYGEPCKSKEEFEGFLAELREQGCFGPETLAALLQQSADFAEGLATRDIPQVD